MLSMKRNVTLTGESLIDGVSVAGYSATIKSDNPADITLSSWRNSKELYKANRSQCRKDQAEFEDAAYALQDEMLGTDTAEEDAEESAEDAVTTTED